MVMQLLRLRQRKKHWILLVTKWMTAISNGTIILVMYRLLKAKVFSILNKKIFLNSGIKIPFISSSVTDPTTFLQQRIITH